jgi:hypothetical protein
MQRSIPFLWGLVIILLVLNLILLDALNLARRTAIVILSEVETTLDHLANEVIVYNVEVNQAVPVKVDVPFNRRMEIPLNTVVPIDQELSVPFQTPAGEVMLSVPVKTEVPIDTVVPVDFNQTVSVDTAVQLKTTVPVKIDIAQTPLAAYLKETKQDLAKLRSRLSLKREAAAVEETVAPTVSGNESSVSSAPTTAGASQSQTLPAGSEPIAVPDSESAPEPDTAQISQRLATDLPLSSGKAIDQAKLGLCRHPYWPLWPGTIWTYNSQNSSYSYHVDDISDNQALLSTQYEGRDIQFSLACSEEGLGGNYLGDVRRLTELGQLSFSKPRGLFLPGPERMEEIGKSWTQELDVTGTVQAHQGDNLVEGKINRGRAVAVYTPARFETVETPLGPQEALRVEQRLDLELDIGFDLEGQTIPATEIVNLNTVYWFVKDIGLVKMHWQGGTIQQSVEMGNTPVNQQPSIPALAEDQLVILCVTLEDQSLKCARLGEISQSDLTAPPDSELEVQAFVLPGDAGNDDSVSGADTGSDETPKEPAGDTGGHSDLLAYAAAVDSLGQRLYQAAQEFGESAIKFRDGQMTRDEFREKFLKFAPQVRGLVQEIGRLSPPSEAEAIHQKLTGGLAKCDQALDLMDDWFDSPSSGTKDAAALLVGECVEDVTAAGEELDALIGRD